MAKEEKPVILPDYIGLDRRKDSNPKPPNGEERRSSEKEIEQRAFEKAVTVATLATTKEVTKVYLNRFLFLVIAIVIAISTAVALPVALNSDSANKTSTEKAVQEDCQIIVQSAVIITDYINFETSLREARSRSLQTEPEIRNFDHTLDNYWQHITLPELKRFIDTQCTPTGPVIPSR